MKDFMEALAFTSKVYEEMPCYIQLQFPNNFQILSDMIRSIGR